MVQIEHQKHKEPRNMMSTIEGKQYRFRMTASLRHPSSTHERCEVGKLQSYSTYKTSMSQSIIIYHNLINISVSIDISACYMLHRPASSAQAGPVRAFAN